MFLSILDEQQRNQCQNKAQKDDRDERIIELPLFQDEVRIQAHQEHDSRKDCREDENRGQSAKDKPSSDEHLEIRYPFPNLEVCEQESESDED